MSTLYHPIVKRSRNNQLKTENYYGATTHPLLVAMFRSQLFAPGLPFTRIDFPSGIEPGNVPIGTLRRPFISI